MSIGREIITLYQELQQKVQLEDPEEWGSKGQWPIFGIHANLSGYDERWEMMVGAILVRGGWVQGRKALKQLISQGLLTLDGIYQCPNDSLLNAISSAAYKNQKLNTLKQLATLIVEEWGGSLNRFLVQEVHYRTLFLMSCLSFEALR